MTAPQMSVTEIHNWKAAKATFEAMQAELRELRARCDATDAKASALAARCDELQRSLALTRAGR